MTSTTVDTVASALTRGPAQAGPVRKLDGLDIKKKDSPLNTVRGAAKVLAGGKSLGGLPLHS